MTTANQVLSEVEYDVVGKRPVRPDGVDKVTGRAQYGADLDLTGLLHARVLRSPHAHARIKSIDTSAAEALAGVRAVVTAADLPFATLSKEDLGNDYNRFKFLSDNFLASDKALYRGQAIAAVAADNAHTAEAALALIDVDYEVLEPVIDVRAAMQDGAPLLHDDLIHTSAMGETSDKPSNVASYMKFEKGDTAAGFANSDVIVEREFTTASVHQGYIEPHNATAHWRADGQINIWCSTQGAFVVRAKHRRCPEGRRIRRAGHPHGDRRRLRRQGLVLPGAGSRVAVAQGRCSGQGVDEPHRGIRGQRAGSRKLDAGQDGRQLVRQDYRCRKSSWPSKPAHTPVRR